MKFKVGDILLHMTHGDTIQIISTNNSKYCFKILKDPKNMWSTFRVGDIVDSNYPEEIEEQHMILEICKTPLWRLLNE